jgi:phage-related protein
MAEVGNRAREPLSKSLGNGLFEFRAVRSYFLLLRPGGVIVLLHGFTKKSQKTPAREMETAIKRMQEVSK